MNCKKECLIFLVFTIIYAAFNWLLAISDPVESNYALTAKEMLLRGDYMSTRIYGAVWFDKPIFIYWSMIVAYLCFGVNEFAARLPMAVASGASLTFLFWFARRLYGERCAWFSVGILATCLEFWIVGKLVITDAQLFLFDCAAIALFYLGIVESRRAFIVLGYGLAGLAVLTKGPVGIVLPFLILGVYFFVTREAKRLAALCLPLGMALFLLVSAPWYAYMYILHGDAFLEGLLGLHNVTRAMVSEHPKDNVFYYYLIVVPISMLPWTGILLRGIWRAIKTRTARRTDLFLWIWAIVTVGFYTLMATKYLTYAFIALFPLAILTAHCAARMAVAGARRRYWTMVTLPWLLLLIGSFFGARRVLPENVIFPYIVLVVLIAVSVWLQLKANGELIFKGIVASVAVWIVLLSGCVLPYFSEMRSGITMAAHLPQQEALIGSFDEYETSLVFYSGRQIVRLDRELSVGGAWSGKYTMPKMTYDVFDRQAANVSAAYIVVDPRRDEAFQKTLLAPRYRPVYEDKRHILYQRQSDNTR